MTKNAFTRSLFAVSSLFVSCFFTPHGGEITTASAQNAYLQAKAECVMEANSRRILYASHSDVRLPMASTTKILTAATILEECDNLGEEIVIPPEAEGVEGSSVYLKSGDVYTVEDLLYGLMLRSGNDCATALALRFGGNVAGFASKMNVTAQKAGAFESRFENPHGLPNGNHYTTAQDLSYITCYAMQNPIFRKIVSTQYYRQRHWKNKNKMLSLYEGGIGVKTGYTKEAGRCLVSAAERNGMTLVCTVLNCPTTYERSIALLDDAFSAYEYTCLIEENRTFALGSGRNQYKAVAKQAYYYPLLKEEKELVEIKTHELSAQEMGKNKEKIVGQFEIYLSNRLLFSGNLYKL